MKTLKKVLVVVLALAMLSSLALSAFATSITVSNVNTGHTLTAYQIIKGNVNEKEELTNPQWGDNVDSDKLLQAVAKEFADELQTFQDKDGKVIEVNDAASLVAFLGFIGNEQIAIRFAKIAAESLNETAGTKLEEKDGSYKVDDIAAGYYLVIDESIGSEDKYDSMSRYILEVVGDAKATAKKGLPTVDKEVLDTNDSTNEADAWGETADHDIGDHVSFRLTGTLPSDYADYDSYKYVFHDKLSEGLTFDGVENLTITIGDKVITYDEFDDYGIEVLTGENTKCKECNLEIRIHNLKATVFGENITSSTEIVVDYTATLNENAKIGAEGNPNTVGLEFSNNPNYKHKGENDTDEDDEEPTGETPEDTVIVFTFEFDVNKVDQDNNPLAGAGFQLQKWNEETKNWDIVTFKLHETDDGSSYYVVSNEEGALDVLTGEDLKNFKFAGLDDGKYKLVEKVTPNGYNSIADIEFTVVAKHVDGDKDGEEKLVSVTFSSETAEIESSTLGVGSTDIVNQKGATLPETGGIGTTIFYVVGGLMVALAVVLLVTKKRMSNND